MGKKLDAKDYIFKFNQISQIIKYVNDKSAKYKKYGIDLTNLSSNADMTLFKKLINEIKEHLLIPNEKQNFYKAFKSFDSRIDRINIIRLCFALELNHQEATEFLLNYMHEAELSARSFLEFLAICALHSSEMTWKDVYDLSEEYKAILNIPASPDNPGSGMTQQVIFQEVPKLTSVKAIRSYLDPVAHPEHLDFFAKTGNTQYLALFDDVRIDFIHNRADLAKQKQKCNPLSVSGYYSRLFGIHSLDGDMPENFLTTTEINCLIKIYPDVFVSKGVFDKLVDRTSNKPIASGTFLLHLLVTMESSYNDKRHGIDFTKIEKVMTYINDTMLEAGYPKLDEDNPFDKLVIDVINSNCNTNSSSEDNRKKILSEIRSVLKDIVVNH